MDDLNLCLLCIAKTLLLLAIANGAPVFARNAFGSRFAWPIDLDRVFWDRRPLFGFSKTWRGMIASIALTALLAPLLARLPMPSGALFGMLAMSGDLLSSFIKRRLGYIESSRCRLLDAIPESLIPVLLLHDELGLAIFDVVITVTAFFILQTIASPLLYRLHIRKRPY